MENQHARNIDSKLGSIRDEMRRIRLLLERIAVVLESK